MRLLDRYLLRELLVPFGYCLLGFLVFWISFDLISELSGFQKLQLQLMDVMAYYVLRTPEFLVVVLPVALLLALLYALTNHGRHQELTAIRAAGVGLWRLAAPYLAVGCLLSLLLFGMNESWAPRGADAAEQMLKPHGAGDTDAAPSEVEHTFSFRNDRANRTWTMAEFNLTTCEMLNLRVSWALPDGSVRDILAERGVWEEGTWIFTGQDTNVQIIVYPPGRGQVQNLRSYETNRLVMPEFAETPEEIRAEIKVEKMKSPRAARRIQLSIREIRTYQRLHPDEHTKRPVLLTKLHSRWAAPWTCVVVVLIALPFGAAPGRRNVFVGVAASIVICFGYFVLQQLGLAMGSGGTIPAWLAAWGPNLIFAMGGVALVRRIR